MFLYTPIEVNCNLQLSPIEKHMAVTELFCFLESDFYL